MKMYLKRLSAPSYRRSKQAENKSRNFLNRHAFYPLLSCNLLTGTVEALVPVLHAEANIYKQMDTIKDKAIPIYLGSIDLTSHFHLTTRAAIVHLMLLSLAGEESWRFEIVPKRLRLETIRTNREVAALGVQQGDLRGPNVLWNSELDRVIMIDFARNYGKRSRD